MKRTFFLIILLVSFQIITAQQINVKGKVLNSSGNPVPYVNVIVENTQLGTTTDEEGNFSLYVTQLPTVLIFSHISYEEKKVKVVDQEFLTITLKEKVLELEKIFVSAIRAEKGKTPIAFSNITKEEIAQIYTVEDVPMVLAYEPGIYAYSESGNGTGYSYVSIRGFDQSKIAVMIDNVPLNDNESHQVYWVDHTDILSDAQDVQIQRGIGNSLYGSSAFGGSINVLTEISRDIPYASLTLGKGSFNTSKIRAKFSTRSLLGKSFTINARVTQTTSDGYREYHDSFQRAGFLGVEHRTNNLINQFRALIGYENTNLVWDGVPAEFIKNRKLRRKSYKAYTDDFLQQIYSLNTKWEINEKLFLSNVAYLVKGAGYYKNYVTDKNYYEYNLDIYNEYPDSVELKLESSFWRRRWIVNTYYGTVPTITYKAKSYRIDIGGELRYYKGNHFGEVKDFSDSTLNEKITEVYGKKWYKYYQYYGMKTPYSFFIHTVYNIHNKLVLVGDLQYQYIKWKLDQKKIGHAAGHKLTATWPFFNPRIGIIYNLTDNLSVFANYGKAHKEPADDQIIDADDVWSEPVMAAAEVIDDYELGVDYISNLFSMSLNYYYIKYFNEQLKNIDVEQEGEYDYYSADRTLHSGLEFDLAMKPIDELDLHLNFTYSDHKYRSGSYKNNKLPYTPNILTNVLLKYRLSDFFSIYGNAKYVGKQFIDSDNIGKIDPYLIIDIGLNIKLNSFDITFKVNNLFDTLYETFGYGYEWEGTYYAFYWPGATRNIFGSITFKL